ncbi:MAG: hypothetical protein MUO73_01985 [Thermoplasmata archaeon]|nr:hypothetical protein [Thermoplasmata archaeon]
MKAFLVWQIVRVKDSFFPSQEWIISGAIARKDKWEVSEAEQMEDVK